VLIILLIQGIIFGLFSAYIANEKNRNGTAWFFLGFFFSILSIFALIAIPRKDAVQEHISKAPLSKTLTAPNELDFTNRMGDIGDKSYQMYLVSKFGITKNEVLNVYGLGGVAYEKLDEAILTANRQHEAQLLLNNQNNTIEANNKTETMNGYSCTIYADGSVSLTSPAGKVSTFKTEDDAYAFTRKYPIIAA
jgi:hypothetical protein